MARRILVALVLMTFSVFIGSPIASAAESTAPSAAPAPSASASPGGGGVLELAASALKTRDVYVGPGAPTVDESRLTSAIGALTGPPIKVAVLPASAANEVGGNPAALPGQISFLVGQGGTVVVLAGQQVFAASTVVNGANLDAELAAAGPGAASTDAQTRTDSLLSVAESGSTGRLGIGEASSEPSRAGTPGGGVTALVVVGVIAACGAVALLVAWDRHRRLGPAQERVDVDMLGRIIDIGPDVEKTSGAVPVDEPVEPVPTRHRQEES
jgi:hypothetical protein